MKARGWKRQDDGVAIVLITRDRIVCLGVLALSVFAWIEAQNYPQEARVFPQIILIGMFAMNAVILAKSFVAPAAEDGPFIQNPRNFAVILVGVGLYILGLGQLGFFTATALYMLVFSFLIGYRHIPQLLAVTAAFVAFLWVVFVWLFKRPLPPEFWQQ